jgi:Condensation domain
VQRYKALRTTFQMMEGQPAQVIAPTLTIPLPVIDLRDLPEAEREAEVQRLTTQEAQRPFDLTRGPLVRATVLQLEAEESLGVLLRELAALYEAFSTGRPSPFADWRGEASRTEHLHILAEHLRDCVNRTQESILS